ncbi:hypothetical protein EU803_14860 [Loktanella sp. IMCC34160]|uniref:hypothetical protein n=1 Tax=Loktanella sp. IMCC34160 TaxID=2510646 RepID=UPI00101BFE8D|nr:hypothetical protein [Loktanella sp. IMCC34160]RYG89902.1 hypothetical protein EU803_14860 [Loktanella sp. IMCC34160]
MKTSLCLAMAAAILAANPVASQGLTCGDVYLNAIRNVTISTRDRSTNSFYFNLYCERDGSIKSGSFIGGMNFPIEGIPIGVSSDGSWDQNELRQFCSVGAEQSYYEASDLTYGSFVVTDALTSFNQCLYLQGERLIVSHQEAPPAGFVIFGEFTSPTVRAQILSIDYDPDELSCTSTSFSANGSREDIDGNRVYDPNGENFSISCTRTKHTFEDREFYRRTWFLMATSLGPYTVMVPEDTHLGFELASHAEAAFDSAITERNNAIAAMDTALSQVQALQQRIRTIQPQVFRAYQGDSHEHHANGQACPQNGGPNMSTYMPTLCPVGTRATGYTVAGSTTGGKCGNNWFTITCLPTQ